MRVLAAAAFAISVWALALAGVALGIAISNRAPPPPPAVTCPAPPPSTVRVTLSTLPPGARVYQAGLDEPIGTTPLEMTLERGQPSFDVQFRLDGYRSIVRTVNPNCARELHVHLECAKRRCPPYDDDELLIPHF